MVDALAPDRSDQLLGEAVPPRRAWGDGSAGPPRPCLDQRHNPSDRGLDRTPHSHVNVRLWHEAAGGPKTNEGSFWSETWTWARVIASRLRPDGLAGPFRRGKSLRGATHPSESSVELDTIVITPVNIHLLTHHTGTAN